MLVGSGALLTPRFLSFSMLNAITAMATSIGHMKMQPTMILTCFPWPLPESDRSATEHKTHCTNPSQ